MGKYSEYVKKFLDDYESPEVDEYIVGFSGITPNKRVKPEEIDHEALGGLVGGDFSGHYHLTGEQVDQYEGYAGEISDLSKHTASEIKRVETKAANDVSSLRSYTTSEISRVETKAAKDISTLRSDTTSEISRVETQTAKDISKLKTDTTAEISRVETKASSDISALRTDTTAEIKRVETAAASNLEKADKATNARIDSLKSNTEAEISRVETKASNEISTLRKDATAEIARVEAKASTEISMLTKDTTEKITSLRTYTDSEIKASEDRASKKIAEASTALNERASKAEAEAQRATTEVAAARAEFVSGINEVKGAQSGLEKQNETLSTRFDAVLSGVTEDSEILDARVDADGNVHQTLGENLRSLQTSLREDISSAREETSAVHKHLQDQADTLASELIRRTFEEQSQQESLKARIAEWVKQHKELEAHIAEQLSDLSVAVIQTGIDLRQEEQRHSQDNAFRRTRLEETVARVKEETDTNAYTLMDLAVQLSRKATGGSIYINPLDWSRSDSLAIPEPRCAVVNVSGINAMPTSKTAELNAVMEFWDMAGNYFKKKIVCGAQGSSSLGFVKKNMKFDLLNDDGSEFDMKIGDWVVQDGFHLKAYYTDFFRGVGVTSYKIWDEIMRFNGLDKDRPYKKALIDTESIKPSGTSLNNPEDLTLQLETGALCHPDGFPCLVYLNGEFYGIFSWQIKKQRKNYRLEKSTVEHIHLDGTLSTGNFWNGTINWTAFEIRNPNKLYTMDGKKYDGDAPKELIDETSEKYDASNKDHVRSAKVKGYIKSLVQRFTALKQTYTTYQKSDPTRVKAAYEGIFDWENMRDYLIFSDVVKNNDGTWGKNWQWTTYDGVHWYVNAYDLDMSYGGTFNGASIGAPLTNHVTTNTALPVYYVALLYKSELETRYRELRDAGIISVKHIISKLEDWILRIGTANYELEYKRWPNSPCIKNYTDSLARVKKWLEVEIANMDNVYNYEPESAKLYKRLDEIEEAIQELCGGILTYKGAAVSRNAEVNAMMKDIFDGDGTGGEALTEIPDELKDEVTTPEDFNDMLDEIFG